jgi:AcrR family transcriptional regulator
MGYLENNSKQSAILAKSKELFWKHGFRRISIEEICREAGTSKMTFYKFYPNKLELAKAVLDMVYNENLSNFRIIIRENTSASVKMQKLMQLKLEGAADISAEFFKDFYSNSNPELTAFIEERTRFLWKESIKDFENGKKEGWLRDDLNVEFLFFLSQKLTGLIGDKELLKFFNSPREMVVEISNLMVYGIVPIR